ncbi:protein cordon-bleu isoform X3 [Anabas testudineus]|uniref:WH2 domain-containing protein n=1 Tax=Anabas testudineus TaxID=64144 RepID=A0A3Q1JVN1_ANATE|nr:protein cordon-bleu isoform X3 [Anabas testudineus]
MAESSKPPLGRMKARAPPPPQVPQPAPRHIFRKTVPDGGGTSGVDAKENMLRPTVDLQLTLPQGYQTYVTEDGSKALMDLLVELCSRYHLNPALHTLELLSPEGHPLGFKPNALLGSLNVACVLIKEKVWEEKVVRRPAPKVPEKTVRLMVNYHGSQKAVVRVNPFVPLQALIPVICDKCEFEPAHVLLLKDSISRHELPLDKSLTELGIKELYVHDQSLDSIRSSNTALSRPEKKGLLSIFQFSRRKSKTETASMDDMDDYDDKVFQNTGTQSNGLSGIASVEDRPSTLAQSQSVMTLPRLSPRTETKKRRAPAPPGALTPIMGQTSFEGSQIGLGSESQQRKRKAPAPPPTPASISPGSDGTSTSAAPTPDSHVTKTPTPAFCTKVAESTAASSTTVVTQTINPVSLKTTVQHPAVSHATPTASSPTPSNSTIDSLAVNDSSSELSHSLDDSDADLDQAASHCSTLSSSTASESQPAVKISSNRMEESEKAAKVNQEATSASSCRSETESALNLKLDEVENNRHSAMGTTDQPAPPKPPRSPALEPQQVVRPPGLSTPLPPSPPFEPTESNSPQSPIGLEEAAPQSWLHSMQSSKTIGQQPETEMPEEETLSLGSSSSSGSSLPDQGYAAFDGMAEGEDSGVVSSPSDTQPTSPEGSLSLDGSSGGRGERLLRPIRCNSSDSDEGSATWESRYRNNDIISQDKSSKKVSYEDHHVKSQLHETLADIKTGLPDHIEIVSAKKTPYTMSTDSNEVPVSVVDNDVPVTAIDDVLEDYKQDIAENEAKSITGTESFGSKGVGFCHQASMESQNKNNNACTTSDSTERCSEDTQQLAHPEQHRKLMENKAMHDKKEEKIIQTKIKVMSVTDTRRKEDKQRTISAVNSNVDMHKESENSELRRDLMKSNTQYFQEKKQPDLPPTTQRSVSIERGEEMHRVFQNNSSSNSTSYGKITHVTSRFGMKTFTVVPPKPSVTHASTGGPAGALTAGAIKIDDQGNMVKVGISRNKADGSLKSGINCKEESVLGKAKAFWNSNERRENNVACSKGVIDSVKENMDGLKSTPTAILETTFKNSNTDNKKTEKKEMLKEETKEPVKDIQVAKEEEAEVENKLSVTKNFQPPSNKPVPPPPLCPDSKRDLFFLKPSRRTSSQYVASAITKCTPRTPVKLNSIPKIPDSSASVKTHTVSFQRSGQSMEVTPLKSSQSSLSVNKQTDDDSKSNPPSPKRSVSYSEYVSDSQRDSGEVILDGFGSCVGSTKETSDVLEQETAKNMQTSGPIQKNVTANNERDNIKQIGPSSPTPAQSSLLQSSAKLPTTPKTIHQGQTSDKKDMNQPPAHLKPDVKPLHPVTVSNTNVTPESVPVTVFGPVKKFRPVICGPMAKETSLHSSLMEAIQTGRGKDRLKKVSTSGPSSMKQTSYVEEQNERSALLAAIRAQSNTERLKKTKSEAAAELEKFKKAASEEDRSAHLPSSSTSPSITSNSSTVIIPPPPPPLPPAPMVEPPPPPPVLPKGKPNTVVQPSANTPMNPALAREAMLEAIRSGSAAERLKKVAVPTKTVHVNGRLGTIQATSSTLPQQ